jgi:hypothetical protein
MSRWRLSPRLTSRVLLGGHANQLAPKHRNSSPKHDNKPSAALYCHSPRKNFRPGLTWFLENSSPNRNYKRLFTLYSSTPTHIFPGRQRKSRNPTRDARKKEFFFSTCSPMERQQHFSLEKPSQNTQKPVSLFMALAHTRLKRGKNSCSSSQSLPGLFEEGENPVWGLEDSSYSRVLGPLATTPIPLPFFEGFSLPWQRKKRWAFTMGP